MIASAGPGGPPEPPPPSARCGCRVEAVAELDESLGLRLGDSVGLGDAQIVLLKPPNFIAQPRGFLELEIGGGFAHPLLEVGEIGLEVVADEVRPLVVAGVDHHAVARRQVRHDVVDVTLDAFGRDAMLEIVGDLLFAAAAGFGERALHRAGHAISVEDHATFDVARGAADGLDE